MAQVTMPKEISSVVDNIVTQFSPSKIYVFSNKRGEMGKTVSFKLCVILDLPDREDVERRIYKDVDSEVPFDVVLYTPDEWSSMCQRKGSFAKKVSKTGVLVYG